MQFIDFNLCVRWSLPTFIDVFFFIVVTTRTRIYIESQYSCFAFLSIHTGESLEQRPVKCESQVVDVDESFYVE